MKLLVDLGSNTVKCYTFENKDLKLFVSKSILFKEGFSEEDGIKSEKIEELINFVEQTIRLVKPDSVDVYATAVFRKLKAEKRENISGKLTELGVRLHILGQEEESEYLHLACVGSYAGVKPLMLVNIGGGSTELVVVQKGVVLENRILIWGSEVF